MKYFASLPAEQAVSEIAKRANNWFDNIAATGYLNKIKKSWRFYYGNYYGGQNEISFGGEQGELVNIGVNHYRNIARNILAMVTATRPAFQARSINSDRKSQIQTKLAQGLLDYYMREKRLERYLKDAVECSIILGSSFIKMEWDSTKGRIYDYIEVTPVFEDGVELAKDNNGDFFINEDGQYMDIYGQYVEPLRNSDGVLIDKENRELKDIPIYEGDVSFKMLSPFDIVFDSSKSSFEDHNWLLCRSFMNKYDLAAKYPEKGEEIKNIETPPEKRRFRVFGSHHESDDIAVYEFFHKETESMPNGRYIVYLDNDIVLMDEINPYSGLPVFRLSPSNVLGSSFGYTDMFDLIPLQESLNSLYSVVLTNQTTFGVQNIASPIGSGIKINMLEGGLNHIEYTPVPNAPGNGLPTALNLTQTPAEIFNFMQQIVRDQETISGVNAVARGNATANNLRSGNALAMVQSQALQYMSSLQQSYIQLIEDVGTGLIRLLRKYANTPRVAAISGITNINEIKEFTGDDLSTIERVVVDVGNSLLQTHAGRSEIAENLIKMNLITSPEKYLAVLNSGNLDALTESEVDELLQTREENETLIMGGEVMAIFTDKHSLHIREHRAVLNSSEARRDPDLIARTQAHIREHIELLKTTDPEILKLIGEVPIAQMAPTSDPNIPQPTNASMEGDSIMTNPEAQSVAVGDNVSQPTPPRPPEPFSELPTTGAELMAGNTGGR